MQDVIGIILAAGRSQRMGAFKPLLPFGNRTVVDACVEAFRSAGVNSIIVVLGHRAEELKNHLKDSGVLFAVNPDIQGDMGSSIACAVRELPQDAKALIVTPVDYPGVPSEVVSQLIQEWQKGQLLVKPTWEGRGGHPVLVDVRFKDELRHLDSELGLKAFFATHMDQVKRLPVQSACIARDLNTWDDYSSLHQEIFGVLPTSKPG